jgi:Mrp family chromosome partitioning ATPase
VLGLVAGAGFAWWRAERMAPVDPAGIQAKLDVPQFATLPSRRGVEAAPLDLSVLSELANIGRVMSAALFHRLDGATGQVVLVSGLTGGGGRSLCALTLAVGAARTGKSVTIIDCDSESRGLTKACNATRAAGLADLLRGTTNLDGALHRFPMLDVPSLHLIPSGSGELDAARLARPEAARMLEPLRSSMDVIIIDGPPLLESSAAVELAGGVDRVLLVVGRDVTSEELLDAHQRLELLDANVIGFVSNEHAASGKPLRVAGMLGLGDVPIAALPSGARSSVGPAPQPAFAPPGGEPSVEDPWEMPPITITPPAAGSTPLGFTLPRRQSSEPDS